MTPLYNNSEYYRKMLDLQERLRKSEEERIRLEERFTLLEHESRSRHEACINRLRMRYIDFLEEQQARDERNHQLLGALERVDSGLALMTAKTDRLGALKKKYEAVLRNEKRRPNGSVTGDSGVASQKDGRCATLGQAWRRDRNELCVQNDDGTSVDRREENRTNDSPFQVRPGSAYGITRSGMHRESSPTHPSAFAFSNFPQGQTSFVRIDRDFGPSFSNVDKGVDDFRNVRRSKYARDSNESIPRSFRSGSNVPRFSSSFGDYRSVDSSLNYRKAEFRRDAGYGNSVVRDLATSGAYEAGITSATRFYDDSKRNGDLDDSKNAISLPRPAENSINEDSKIARTSISRCPRLSEILRQELANDEEYIGGIIENQLERYISKIKVLQRGTEPRSLEEVDHEENTSGDLLNVTLSDDGVDLPVEEKPGERFYPRELDNVLAIAADLAERTATSAINVANNIYQDHPAGIVRESHERSENNVPTDESDEIRKLVSINQPRDGGNSHEDANRCEKFAKLAKNETSADVAKSKVELASGTDGNIRYVTEFVGSEGANDGVASMKTGANEINHDESKIMRDDGVSEIEKREDEFTGPSLDLRRLKGSTYSLMTSEVIADEDNLRDTLEDLEPWNLSALERRVQEILLNDEAQDDFIKTSGKIDGDFVDSDKYRDAILGIDDEFYQPMDQRKTEEAGTPEGSWENDERDDVQGEIKEKNASVEKKDSELEKQERSTDLPTEKIVEEDFNVSRENEIDDVDHNAQYEVEKVDYTYPATGEYVHNENPEETSVVCEGAPGEGGYGERRYFEENFYDPDQRNYDQDTNQREYIEDSNGQSVQDAGEGNYGRDSDNREYIEDPDQQGYVQDVNWREYNAGSNEEDYLGDCNQQYDNNFNDAYSTDPNQGYPEDSTQEYSNDPIQEYHEDSAPPYPSESDQRYPEDSEHRYPAGSIEKYPEDNQEYLADPSLQYPEPQHPAVSDEGNVVQPAYDYSANIGPDEQDAACASDRNSICQNGIADFRPRDEGPVATEECNQGAEETTSFDECDEKKREEDSARNADKKKSLNSGAEETASRKHKDVIKSILDSDTDSTIEKNVSNTESDFDFN